MTRRPKIAAIGAASLIAVALSAVPAQADTGSILTADNPIADSYIVVLNDTFTQSADTLATHYNATINSTYHVALTGFAATMSEPDAKRLAADPSVDYIQQNGTVTIDGTQTDPPSWGLDRIDQRHGLDNSYTYPNTGNGAEIYILDTGIRTTHQDFDGRASWGINTVDDDDTDCNGHGTHVAGTAAGTEHGVAKEAQLIAVKVLGCSGSGTYEGVIAGIDWVTQTAGDSAVANMSLGGPISQAVDDAILASVASGITYTLAAGNDGSDACNFSPARTGPEPGVITVGNSTQDDTVSPTSNVGPCVDLYAPGSEIVSTWNTSDTATQFLSGTSMAAPHVAGAAAIILTANSDLSPAAVEQQIIDDATSIDTPAGNPYLLLYINNDII